MASESGPQQEGRKSEGGQLSDGEHQPEGGQLLSDGEHQPEGGQLLADGEHQEVRQRVEGQHEPGIEAYYDWLRTYPSGSPESLALSALLEVEIGMGRLMHAFKYRHKPSITQRIRRDLKEAAIECNERLLDVCSGTSIQDSSRRRQRMWMEWSAIFLSTMRSCRDDDVSSRSRCVIC